MKYKKNAQMNTLALLRLKFAVWGIHFFISEGNEFIYLLFPPRYRSERRLAHVARKITVIANVQSASSLVCYDFEPQ